MLTINPDEISNLYQHYKYKLRPAAPRNIIQDDDNDGVELDGTTIASTTSVARLPVVQESIYGENEEFALHARNRFGSVDDRRDVQLELLGL
jgi:hypothetical protein